jgi:hypothetical protein
MVPLAWQTLYLLPSIPPTGIAVLEVSQGGQVLLSYTRYAARGSAFELRFCGILQPDRRPDRQHGSQYARAALYDRVIVTNETTGDVYFSTDVSGCQHLRRRLRCDRPAWRLANSRE